jgi:hypothetical protein
MRLAPGSVGKQAMGLHDRAKISCGANTTVGVPGRSRLIFPRCVSGRSVPAGPAIETLLRHILQLNLGGHRGGVPNDAILRL